MNNNNKPEVDPEQDSNIDWYLLVKVPLTYLLIIAGLTSLPFSAIYCINNVFSTEIPFNFKTYFSTLFLIVLWAYPVIHE